MDQKQVEYLVTGLNKFHWNNDYRAFCETLNFNPETQYSEEKWNQFLELITALGKFDINSLCKMIGKGLE